MPPVKNHSPPGWSLSTFRAMFSEVRPDTLEKKVPEATEWTGRPSA
jgi:hypothetical protein